MASKASHRTCSLRAATDVAPVKTLDNGRRVLLIDGVVQSVHPEDAATGYWSRMLPEHAQGSALLLGFGGGTVARLLEQRFGPIAITGVDDSDEMLKAATDFGAPLTQLRLVKADAFSFIHKDSACYGFIAVDLFRAHRLERRVLALHFLRVLAARLEPGGTVAFNLFQDAYLNDCIARLERVFEQLRLSKIGENAVFHGRPQRARI